MSKESQAGPADAAPMDLSPVDLMQRIVGGLSDLGVSSIIRKVLLAQKQRESGADPALAAIRDSALDGTKVWNRESIEEAMGVFSQHPSLRDESDEVRQSISPKSYFVEYLAKDRGESEQADLRTTLYNTFSLLCMASNVSQRKKELFFNSFPPPPGELLCLKGNDSRTDNLKNTLGAQGIERHIIDAHLFLHCVRR